MDGIIAYILAKRIALGAVSGIANITLNNNQLVFEFKDGTSASMNIPLPNDGISIVNVEVDENGHLICTMSNNTTIDAGELPSTGVANVGLATMEDIDKLFENDPQPSGDLSLATTEDIDKLFDSEDQQYNLVLASAQDIDKFFE